jgi:hypothetical protein
MDKQTKVEIKVVVRDAIREAMECYQERWLTDREMSQYISVMTKRWLRDHGDMLPRTPIEWEDTKGARHTTSYLYPLHRIQAMMADGRIKELRESKNPS